MCSSQPPSLRLPQPGPGMEFRFLEPRNLIDAELSLVAPDVRWIDDMLSSCAHPRSRSDSFASSISREKLMDFLRAAPGGHHSGDPSRGIVPAYHFWMRVSRAESTGANRETRDDGEPPVRISGGIGLRIGNTHDLDMYYGHVGYNVLPPARGNHYAERACRLLLPLARAHGMRTLWITCNPENIASRRTCERLGCTLVEIVELPVGHPLHLRGEREKCRYRLDL